MNNFLQWFRRIFIDPSVPFAGINLNLFKLIGFLSVCSLFVLIARYLRRLLRRILPRLGLERNAQERVLWLVFIAVVFIGVLVGLSAIGIDLNLRTILTASLSIGGTNLNLAKLLWFLGVVVGSIILSKYLRVVLREQVLPPFQLPENTQFLLLRLIHIGIIILGIFIGINLTGLSLSSLTVVLGGLSIGIGFGLQNIASNLISGLILIFERPIRVGDWITVGETVGTVSAINMRSTLIITLDNIDVIVPNSQLVSETITNWTLRDKQVRMKITGGVAYGSDTALVKQALLEVARAHPQIIKEPDAQMPMARAPIVRFINFGASSLDFELLAWIPDLSQRFDVISDLHFMIDQKFREYNINIPFPQRDVYVYTPEKPSSSGPVSETS
jgi:small-conductance mechanosensitive channel